MLSKEQQDIIENSIWVVNTALKKQGLQADEDLRQSAILYMCECIQRFDPTQQVKWTTFAYKSVYLYIQRQHKKEMVYNSRLLPEEMFYVVEKREDEKAVEQYYEQSEIDLLMGELKSQCTKEERIVLELKSIGLRGSEINEVLGCSKSKTNGLIQSIKEKAQKGNGCHEKDNNS